MKNKNILENLAAVTAGKVKTSGVSAFNELEISKVYPNPNQPRKQFDDIEELAANIKEHGLLQPITVVKKDDGYMIVSGERRYKAHLHNGAKTIMALILTSSDEQVEELTLIENIQRSDLTDFEVAKYILRLWESGRYAKKSDLANRICKSDSFVSKAFSCFKLDNEIIDHIEENKKNIPISVMDEIARVGDADTQKEVYEKYNNKEITRDEIKDFKPKKEKKYDDRVFEVLEENPPLENIKEKLDYANEHNLIYDEKNDWYKIPVKNFPRENKETIDDIQGSRTIIKRIVGVGKPILNPNNEQTYLPIEDIGGFYLYNTGAGATKMFKKDVSYRLIIEEFNPVFQKLEAIDILNEENEELKVKIKELEKEIEELKENKPTPKEKAPIKDDELKEIKLLELNENDVYIEYMDNESEHISYNKAKTLIKNSKKEYIKYENTGSEKACNFLNTLPKDILKTGTYLKKQYKF